jgi:hypothetical protein
MLNLFFFFFFWLQTIKYKIVYGVQKDVDGHITRSKFSDIKSITLQD